MDYAKYSMEKACQLLEIDSPSGYTENAIDWVLNEFNELGFEAKKTIKGGAIIDFGGKDVDDAILLEAHTDTLGAMVRQIKDDGRLLVDKLGGMNANNAESENCKIITKFAGEYEGTCQLINPSIHVNGKYDEIKRNWDNVEISIDELVKTKEDVKKLGISIGDVVCFDPRTKITNSGYIKSRFLDDKLSVGILLGYAKYLSDNKIINKRKVYAHITVYEEVGHGGAGSVPKGVKEAISVDMGCVGEGLDCDETMVSICAKDSGGPYNYNIVKKLIEVAKDKKIDYAVDVYPHYGSDVESTLAAGNDIRHGLIGPGVYASHGYERSHKKGVFNTIELIKGYLN